MAFEIRNFDKLPLSVTAGAPLEFTYGSTTDDFATIIGTGYFNEIQRSLKIGYGLQVKATDGLFGFNIVAVTPNVVLATNPSLPLATDLTGGNSLSAGLNYLGVNTAGGATTQTIESADIARGGYHIIIKDEDGNATANNITIATEGSETIDGGATATIDANFGSLRLVARGGNLHSIGL